MLGCRFLRLLCGVQLWACAACAPASEGPVPLAHDEALRAPLRRTETRLLAPTCAAAGEAVVFDPRPVGAEGRRRTLQALADGHGQQLQAWTEQWRRGRLQRAYIASPVDIASAGVTFLEERDDGLAATVCHQAFAQAYVTSTPDDERITRNLRESSSLGERVVHGRFLQQCSDMARRLQQAHQLAAVEPRLAAVRRVGKTGPFWQRKDIYEADCRLLVQRGCSDSRAGRRAGCHYSLTPLSATLCTHLRCETTAATPWRCGATASVPRLSDWAAPSMGPPPVLSGESVALALDALDGELTSGGPGTEDQARSAEHLSLLRCEKQQPGFRQFCRVDIGPWRAARRVAPPGMLTAAQLHLLGDPQLDKQLLAGLVPVLDGKFVWSDADVCWQHGLRGQPLSLCVAGSRVARLATGEQQIHAPLDTSNQISWRVEVSAEGVEVVTDVALPARLGEVRSARLPPTCDLSRSPLHLAYDAVRVRHSLDALTELAWPALEQAGTALMLHQTLVGAQGTGRCILAHLGRAAALDEHVAASAPGLLGEPERRASALLQSAERLGLVDSGEVDRAGGLQNFWRHLLAATDASGCAVIAWDAPDAASARALPPSLRRRALVNVERYRTSVARLARLREAAELLLLLSPEAVDEAGGKGRELRWMAACDAAREGV